MRTILLYLFLFLSVTSFARQGNLLYNIDELTIDNGLPSNYVHEVMQDSYGFIWISTMDGLCRYDGSDFQNFSMGDLGLSSNLVICMAEDRFRNIWIGTTHDGLFCYSREDNRFYHYTELMSEREDWLSNCRRIMIDSEGNIWCYDVMASRLVKFILCRDECKIVGAEEYLTPDLNSRNLTAISESNGDIYVAVGTEIYCYNSEENTFCRIDTSYKFFSVNMIDRRGELLFLADRERLLTLNLNTGAVEQHAEFSSTLFFCWVDSVLWCATSDGVYNAGYDPFENKFSTFKRVGGVEDHQPQTIIKDLANGVWIGYRGDGVKRYDMNRTPFYSNVEAERFNVTTIDEVRGGFVIGTNASGLYRLDSLSSKPKVVNSLPYTPLTIVQSTCQSGDDLIVATNKGLYRIWGRDDENIEVLHKTGSVRKVISDGDYLWLARYRGGLLRYNKRERTTTQIKVSNSSLPSNIIRNLMIDSRDDLWVCTNNGLVRIDGDSRFTNNLVVTPVAQSVAQSHYVISIAEDRNGDIWYGTLGRGISRVSSGDLSDVVSYTKKDGLASNIVNAIEVDDYGAVWFSTSQGLSQITYNRSGEAIMKSFGSSDIRAIGSFNELSSVRLHSGELLFGGTEGYRYFDTKAFSQNLSRLVPIITDFKIEGQSIYKDSGVGEIIPGGVAGERGIELDHDQNNFSIKFSALHYSNPSKCLYRYVLDGVDRKWITSSADMREVNYSNIHSGKYTFYLEVMNAQGEWSSERLEIPINIGYPFWLQWYAIVLYAILLGVIGYYVIVYAHGYLERRNAIKLERIERKRSEEMLDMRTRFFTNVSHEFRTPLTLILSPLQYLMEDQDVVSKPKNREMLSVMQHNGDSLLRLINEFLNYTKQESGELKAQSSLGDFTALTQQLLPQFRFWAERQKVTLNFDAPQGIIRVNFDPYLMEQIIYNLVSNAIKYTSANGTITVAIEPRDQSVIFSVKDSGCGVPEEQQSHIFERFYSRATESSKEIGGTGIGLFLTKKLVELHSGRIYFESIAGEGTTFFVELPLSTISEDDEAQEVAEFEVDEVVSPDDLSDEDITPEAQLSTLLIVDDNSELLQLLRTLFEDRYQVLLASDGVEGWEVASTQLPDIIISDVMMPRMNGVELCERLKGDATTSHIPIIMLSAKASSDDIAAGLRATADAYCPKPFNNTILREMTNSILQNRRLAAMRTMQSEVSRDDVESLVDMCDNATTSVDRVLLARLIKYIEENLDNPELSVTDVCDHMGFSTFTLNKKLKSLLNMTLIVLIRTIRLRKASMLLKSSRYSVAEAAYDVGFSDLKYFRRCFKQEFGVLPQEYKSQSANS